TRFSRDWSSDVCSSDLWLSVGCHTWRSEMEPRGRGRARLAGRSRLLTLLLVAALIIAACGSEAEAQPERDVTIGLGYVPNIQFRSEERRVGKGGTYWGG